jgi:hypothetical protein
MPFRYFKLKEFQSKGTQMQRKLRQLARRVRSVARAVIAAPMYSNNTAFAKAARGQSRDLILQRGANHKWDRFREVLSDPIGLLIKRDPRAGLVIGDHVFLHNGNLVPVCGPGAYYGGFSDLLVISRGIHEPLEEYAFQEVMRRMPERPIMFEVGAYWGHYSMWLKRCRPLAQVILVEPEHVNIKAGKINFANNEMDGEFVQAYAQTGDFEVDRFMSERSLAHLDILHADIQGAEVEMLRDAASSLERHVIDYVFISTHSPELHKSVIDILRRHGYRVEISSDLSETTSSDGFVLATSHKIDALFGNLKALGREDIAKLSPKEVLLYVNGLAST